MELLSLQKEPKLVVYGILNPSADSIEIMVARTYPLNASNVIGPDDIYVDAEVFIVRSESTDTVQLEQLSVNGTGYGCELSELSINPGEKYCLLVKAEGFNSVIASTTVPEIAVEWNETKLIESKVDMDGYFIDGFSFYGTWQKSNTENDQVVSFHIKDSRDNDNGNIETRTYTSGIYLNFSETDHSFIFESPPFHIYKPDEFLPEDSYRWYMEEINAVLITTDIHLYNYISYYLLTEDINNVMDGGSFLDLFRGIMPEFSNVEGGLGIFGSCMTDTAIIYRLNK